MQDARPQAEADQALVEIAGGPIGQPGIDRRANVNRRLVTPPVEVMTTTISTWGCSASTSTWRMVEVSIGGAVTIASRLVTCERVSVVTRIASSSSRRTSESDSPGGAGGCLAGAGGRRSSGTRLGGHAAGRGVGMGQQAQLLQVGQLVADRRRAPLNAVHSALEPTGAPAVEVLLDEAAQHELLAGGQHA